MRKSSPWYLDFQQPLTFWRQIRTCEGFVKQQKLPSLYRENLILSLCDEKSTHSPSYEKDQDTHHSVSLLGNKVNNARNVRYGHCNIGHWQ